MVAMLNVVVVVVVVVVNVVYVEAKNKPKQNRTIISPIYGRFNLKAFKAFHQ